MRVTTSHMFCDVISGTLSTSGLHLHFHCNNLGCDLLICTICKMRCTVLKLHMWNLQISYLNLILTLILTLVILHSTFCKLHSVTDTQIAHNNNTDSSCVSLWWICFKWGSTDFKIRAHLLRIEILSCIFESSCLYVCFLLNVK